MTAAVPDPRFRDQLAETLAAHEPRYRSGYNIGEPDWFECGPAFTEPRCGWRSDPESDDIGADHRAHVASVVAAEVEARVQAAANQRAAEELRAFADSIYIDEGPRYEDRARIVADAHRRAAALAQPEHQGSCRIFYAERRCTCRLPSPEEVAVLAQPAPRSDER